MGRPRVRVLTQAVPRTRAPRAPGLHTPANPHRALQKAPKAQQQPWDIICKQKPAEVTLKSTHRSPWDVHARDGMSITNDTSRRNSHSQDFF